VLRLRALRLGVSLWLALCAAPAAWADPQLTPDEEVARREYRAGADAYERSEYAEALEHFTTARAARSLPALDYNIGRCLDRLGRWNDATTAYERYLAAMPAADNRAEVQARIVELRKRVTVTTGVLASPTPAPIPAPREHRLRLPAGLLLGGALLVEIAGSAVYGVTYRDYATRRDACNGQCPPMSLTGLRSEVNKGQIGSGVLWGIGSAALVADVVLWIVDARRGRRTHIDARRGAMTF
jgi:tetratricopeptide (TPR) repeat protein